MTGDWPWLRYHPGGGALRLVCCPHAGAGAASFAGWAERLAPAVTVVAVQLPGREDRVGEPAPRRVHEAVAGLLPRILDDGPGPVALFGHSMGALVASELARALDAAGRPPVHLFVSGRRAPHLPPSRRVIHALPDDDDFLAAVASMGGTPDELARLPAMRRYALRLLRADLELSEAYTDEPAPPLRCPVTAFVGTEDPVVDPAEMVAWAARTVGPFALHTLPGDHFFPRPQRTAITVRIAAALADVAVPPSEESRAPA